jgi:hypothetical protein
LLGVANFREPPEGEVRPAPVQTAYPRGAITLPGGITQYLCIFGRLSTLV